MSHVICIDGGPCSGKSSVMRHLEAQEYPVPVVFVPEMATQIDARLRRAGSSLGQLAVHDRPAYLEVQQEIVDGYRQRIDDARAALPPASLVVNATGMGKDRPGSPVSTDVRFPERGVVWEFNYRGPLDFWHQALAQQEERSLHVEDGWRYFVHGWTQAVAEVFDVPMPAATVAELGRIAAEHR